MCTASALDAALHEAGDVTTSGPHPHVPASAPPWGPVVEDGEASRSRDLSPYVYGCSGCKDLPLCHQTPTPTWLLVRSRLPKYLSGDPLGSISEPR